MTDPTVASLSSRLVQMEPTPSLEAYEAAGGGAGLRAALDRSPAEVREEVRASGLRGRGGAGFPTGVKWESVATAESEGPRYVVCNAAEGEPGTYKDRVLLDENPYRVLEGVLIAAHAVGAAQSFIGVKLRFEGPLRRLTAARDEMAAAGWPGAEQISIVPGPRDYLFGEEKALLEVVEGKAAMPRILPPYQLGLFATMQSPNPTVVNNVETLAHATEILAHGADWFRQVGTEDSPGTMIFTVVGDVASPGYYELPLGTELGTLLVDIAGARDIKAVYSGTSNAVITPALLELPMDFDVFPQAGTGLGSGGFAVYDTSRCMVQVTAALARFLADESCGQCLACMLGTGDIADRLETLVRGEGSHDDLDAIRQRVVTVTDQNRCYLPVGAQLTIGSTLELFSDEFEARVGTPSPPERAVSVPLIEHIDPNNGEVAYERE